MSIVSYLEEVVDDNLKYTQNNEEVHFNCVMGCGDTRHRMYVNLSTHTVYCHNCNYSASFIRFISDLENISYGKAVERYKEIKGSAYIPEDILSELHNTLFIGDVSKSIEKRAIPLPKEYVELNFKSKNPLMIRAINYLVKKRKMTIRQIKQHHFGICVGGEYDNRIIIPITEFGEIKFFVARAIGTKAKLKEKSPSNESYQISKSQVLFNIDHAAVLFNSCVLCEGIFDALSFGDIGVSMLGKRLSDEQLAILLDYKDFLTKGIYIALDWDARSNAIKLAKQLSEYFKVYLIFLPKGDLEKGYDPNDYYKEFGRKAMYELIDNAEEYNFSFHLRRKLFE